jgi:hypothetical protein
MRALVLAAFLYAAGAAFADARADAIGAGVVDCLTTGEALAGVGFHEVNPVGALGACALKVPLVAAANKLPEPDRTVALHTQRAAWDGTGAHNLALLAGMSSTAAIGIGIVVAAAVWQSGAEEREFAELCKIHEQLAWHPMHCVYTPSPAAR